MEKKRKIVVFDLDQTLWPFWVDSDVTPPFRKKSDKVVDVRGRNVKYFADVPDVLKRLYDEGYELGIASRTTEIEGAKQLLNLFGWEKYFKYIEIFPGSKKEHFSNIQKNSKIDYEDMLFFDDEHRNVVEVAILGVYTVLAPNGVNFDLIEKSLDDFKNHYYGY